ncbi:MAG: CPXCG motif-containing cysteine-rich protein [Litorimonas sp.]
MVYSGNDHDQDKVQDCQICCRPQKLRAG